MSYYLVIKNILSMLSIKYRIKQRICKHNKIKIKIIADNTSYCFYFMGVYHAYIR